MIKVYNFPPHIKGDTFKGKTFKVDINGSFIDTSLYTVKMQLRKGMSEAYPVVLELTTADGGILKSGTNDGLFWIPEQDIGWDNAIPTGKYVFDIEFTNDVTGKRSTWIKGIWKFNRQTTQNG